MKLIRNLCNKKKRITTHGDAKVITCNEWSREVVGPAVTKWFQSSLQGFTTPSPITQQWQGATTQGAAWTLEVQRHSSSQTIHTYSAWQYIRYTFIYPNQKLTLISSSRLCLLILLEM